MEMYCCYNGLLITGEEKSSLLPHVMSTRLLLRWDILHWCFLSPLESGFSARMSEVCKVSYSPPPSQYHLFQKGSFHMHVEHNIDLHMQVYIVFPTQISIMGTAVYCFLWRLTVR